jgi:hypothetical protein
VGPRVERRALVQLAYVTYVLLSALFLSAVPLACSACKQLYGTVVAATC